MRDTQVTSYRYVDLGGTLFWEISSSRDVQGRTHICDMNQEFGLAYDRENGAVLKHGSGDRVRSWVEASRSKLMKGGELGIEMANSLEAAYFPATPETIEIINRSVIGFTPDIGAVLRAIAEAVSTLPPDHIASIPR
ncbi:hypothetical protein [Bosea sp. RAC05]|uniref:hypothetical protein n=1 Tax=Bosea sp. RAC05 TaxID=1842539 RepID=UPI000858BF88|nr:hypothetical protein [Bosea sp. RAC05]AOG03064.1 hypothetical protein BSY19_5298 [Bosea sp. RAC05]